MVKDILMIACLFRKISFVHEYRRNNEAAHTLAKWGSHSSKALIFMEDVPSSPCIVEDMEFAT